MFQFCLTRPPTTPASPGVGAQGSRQGGPEREARPMHIDFTPEQKALRQELRAYYQDLLQGDLRRRLDEEWDQLGGPAFREAMGRMGKDGWLVIGWPEAWGGQGRGHICSVPADCTKST